MRVVALFLVVIALASCETPAFLTPPTGPGTPWPCGYYGVSCVAFDNTHTCCPEFHSCIKDGCEYQGNDHTFGASPKPLPRRAEQ